MIAVAALHIIEALAPIDTDGTDPVKATAQAAWSRPRSPWEMHQLDGHDAIIPVDRPDLHNSPNTGPPQPLPPVSRV